MSDHEPALAVLVDFENMARPGIKGRDDFDVAIVLNRLADKGRVLVKRAYADWSRYRDARHALISAGLELIEMPSAREGAKNRADIKMAVDAMELVYSREHLDNFVLVSGDSDFTPLVGKLRELNKRVIGVGNRESASELLIANCDEFIFYDKLAGTSRARRGTRTDPVELLKETLGALSHESTELPLASVVKDSMRRKSPAFDETDLGFANFSKFLEDVAEKGHVTLQTDPRSGTYRVEMPEEQRGTVTAVRPRQASEREEAGDGRRRRRRSRRRGGREDGAEEGGAEVFEFVVASDPEADGDEAVEATVVVQDISAGLPPLDEPISYEHVVLLAPELDLAPEDETELVEASDATIAEEPAPAGRRRRTLSETSEAPVRPTTAEAEETDATPGRRRRVRRRTPAEPPEGTPAAYAEPVSAPALEAAATPEADAPTETPAVDETSRRRRTVRRRGASTGETPADATPQAAEPEAEEKPKRRRSSRAKAAEPEAEEKPKRRRSSRSKAAEPEAEAGDASAVGEAAEPEAEEKPKRRRSSRSKAAEPEAEAGEASAVGEAAEPEAGEPAAEEKPKRRRGSKAQAAEPEAAAAEASASNAGDPTADATPEAAEPEAEERPKRRRRTARAAAAVDEES